MSKSVLGCSCTGSLLWRLNNSSASRKYIGRTPYHDKMRLKTLFFKWIFMFGSFFTMCFCTLSLSKFCARHDETFSKYSEILKIGNFAHYIQKRIVTLAVPLGSPRFVSRLIVQFEEYKKAELPFTNGFSSFMADMCFQLPLRCMQIPIFHNSGTEYNLKSSSFT